MQNVRIPFHSVAKRVNGFQFCFSAFQFVSLCFTLPAGGQAAGYRSDVKAMEMGLAS